MATLNISPLRVTTTFGNIFRSSSCGDGRPRPSKPSIARRTACDHSNSELAIERVTQLDVSRLLSVALLLARLARQTHRIFVRALAESAFHPPREADRRFPEFI